MLLTNCQQRHVGSAYLWGRKGEILLVNGQPCCVALAMAAAYVVVLASVRHAIPSFRERVFFSSSE